MLFMLCLTKPVKKLAGSWKCNLLNYKYSVKLIVKVAKKWKMTKIK